MKFFSPSQFWIIERIWSWNISENSNFYFVQNGSKCDKNNLWDLKKLQKTIFYHFQAILDQIWPLEKKVAKIYRKYANFSDFWNFKNGISAGNRQTPADMWPEGPVRSKFFPKFFLSQTDKNSWFYLKKTYPPKSGDFFFWKVYETWASVQNAVAPEARDFPFFDKKKEIESLETVRG